MVLNSQQITILCQVAKVAAVEAGKYIQSRVQDHFEINLKEADRSLASTIVTEVDLESQEIILKQIEPTLKQYNLGFLSEESDDDGSRLIKDYFWAIDPLDGTLAFTRFLYGYSVSISLVSQDGISVIGVIYDPVRERMYESILNKGCFVNSTPVLNFLPLKDVSEYLPCSINNSELVKRTSKVSDVNQYWEKVILANLTAQFKDAPTEQLIDNPPLWIMDQSFFDSVEMGYATRIVEGFFQLKGISNFSIIAQGGAAMNSMWLLEFPHAFYFKPNRTKEGGGAIWDFAAASLILNEAGKTAVTFKGEPLVLNSPAGLYMNLQGYFAT